MNKNNMLKIINPLLFASFVIQAVSGVMLLLGKGGFDELHEYNGVLLIVLAAIHLALNWGWVKSVLPGRK
ncbi:MAG: hypothetical protein A2Z72_06990 [Omnitrophica bacterium RBG_13_46_9]|nr:MAG: hypothetical protein A2Z72_06990 [Omnitrophica bacterium RBG_13_46_9]